jgi:hypothetical protein
MPIQTKFCFTFTTSMSNRPGSVSGRLCDTPAYLVLRREMLWNYAILGILQRITSPRFDWFTPDPPEGFI